MKQSVKAIIWTAVIVLVLGGSYIGYRVLKKNFDQNQTPDQTASSETTQAADFKVYDVYGKRVSLSSKFGTPIVLNFWASWCGPCRTELPDFNKLYTEYGDKVEFVMVNEDSPGTESDVLSFLAENGYILPVYFDTDYEGQQAYNVTGIPVSYFIDAEGRIVTSHIGMISEDALRDNIDLIVD